jgi:hypothetical protein
VTIAAAANGPNTPTKNGIAARLSSVPAIIAGAMNVQEIAKARTKNDAVGCSAMRVRAVVVMGIP